MVATSQLDTDGLLELLRQTDRLGVLSIYLNIDARSDPRLHAAAVELRNRFRQLQQRITGDIDTKYSTDVSAALEQLWPRIENLASPPPSDRSRIAFAALESGRVVRLESAMPVTHRMVLDNGPFIHPLLELLDKGQAAGIVLVSPEQVRLLEWRNGSLQTLEQIQREHVEAAHERSNQIGGGPQGRFHTPMNEQQQARERDQAQRFLTQAAAVVAESADARKWEELLVCGGDRWIAATVRSLPPALRDKTFCDSRILSGLDDAALAAVVTGWIDEQRFERGSRLLRRVHDAAGAGSAVTGLPDVVAALNTGRVAHFIYDPRIRYTGTVGDDDALHSHGEADTNERSGRFDPRFTERLVEKALRTGARVSPIDGAADGQLRHAEGVAALLRW